MITIILVLFVIGITLLYFNKRPHNFPPGPTGIPLLGNIPFLRLPIHKSFQTLAIKYGKIVGIFLGTYPTVVLNDRKLVVEAFKDERLAARPPFRLLEQISFGKKRGIASTNGRPWHEQRRFALKNLKSFGLGKNTMEELIMDDIVELIGGFKNEMNVPISLDIRFNLAVLNSLWHIIAGERYSHNDPKLQNLMEMLASAFDNVATTGLAVLAPRLAKIFNKFSGSEAFYNAVDRIHDFIRTTVNTHKKTLDINNPRDFIDAYLAEIENTTDPESSFWKEEGEMQLLAVLTEFFMAGGKATGVTLNWIFLHLISFPNLQERIQREIDSVVGTSRLPSLKDRPNMPYTQAVIAESMRYTTAGTVGAVHAATEDMQLEGYTIPKDTLVFANVWLLHHDKKYWGDPETFRPERFISKEGVYSRGEGVFSFSTGKRACPGEGLVYDQIFLVLTGLLQKFTFEHEGKSKPSLEPKSSMLALSPLPYNVITRARNQADLKL